MQYAQYNLIDLGYCATVAGIDPLPEIWGLSNQGEESFEHKGITGYPVSHTWMTEKGGKVLALFDGSPDEGGVEVAEADVIAKLMADYGYPAETTLGADGKPVTPETQTLI